MINQMEPDSVFNSEFRVSDRDTDQNLHVNNVVYVQWMQEIAIEHSSSRGGTEAIASIGCIWVVFSHRIDYLAPAHSGDVIEASTWVERYLRVKAFRQYRFLRQSDGILLARGETVWVLVDSETGRPRSIPAEIKEMFLPEND